MNKSIKSYFLFLVIFLTISSTLSAQFGSRGKEFNYVDAENFYKANNYYDALPLYQLLLDKHPRIIEYRLKIGICHLNLADSTEKAIEYLNEVHSRKPKEQNVLYYMGKAYAINYKFEKAIETFNEALTSAYVSSKFKEEIP
ncbi:MAG: tetratricopeptide repeat protein, partial [Vicingaceae bacterium]|nr:tetratricopeptide repeat protein [Vicingaceae bacterium]